MIYLKNENRGSCGSTDSTGAARLTRPVREVAISDITFLTRDHFKGEMKLLSLVLFQPGKDYTARVEGIEPHLRVNRGRTVEFAPIGSSNATKAVGKSRESF